MNESPDRTVRFLVGPTGSGKGRLARALAGRWGLDILSMDSMKVYRGMDVGTAKPTAAEREGLVHRLLDIASPETVFDLKSWLEAAEAALRETEAAGRRALFCGGTGLYLKGFLSGIFQGPPVPAEVRSRLEGEARSAGPEALHARLREVDPAAAERIHPRDARRIVRALEVIEATGEPISSRQVQFHARRAGLSVRLAGIRRPRETLYRLLDARLERMLSGGWLEEVRALTSCGRVLSRSASQGVGYGELAEHLAGRCTLESAVERIRRNTRRLVRKQDAWFRRFPDIAWIEVTGASDAAGVVAAAARALALEG